MTTRQDYMNDPNRNHRQYYAQFVNEDVKAKISAVIGLNALLASKDEHLNDIPMKKWDSLGGFVWQVVDGQEVAIQKPSRPEDILPVDYELLKQANDGISCATMVCIYKEAGKQMIEEATKRKFV